MQMAKIAVLGFGTVGGGVVEHFDVNREMITRAVPEGVEVKHILDLRDFPDSPYKDRVVHDFNIILEDPEISVICETMGGVEPAYTFTKKALEKGISVCTSNKELVAKHGPELIELSKANNCNYFFEASVGGGIPIIRPLTTCLAPEYITSVTGILNGTTNYILSRMEKEGMEFDDVLRQAQENGFAEKNPEADIEGHDACRKIAILSSLATGKTVRYEDIPCEGISRITKEDFPYARRMNRVLKLLGMCRRDPATGAVSVRTAPFLIPDDHPLASVEYVYNAVFVQGNLVNDLMFYGSGAGKTPTASAVVADVLDAVKHAGKHVEIDWKSDVLEISDPAEEVRRFFVRTGKQDKEKAAEIFGEIEEIADASEEEFAFVTAEISESDFAERSAQLQDLRAAIRLF